MKCTSMHSSPKQWRVCETDMATAIDHATNGSTGNGN